MLKKAGLWMSAFMALCGTALAEQCSHIVASAHPDYPPYHWKEGGEIVGASVDLNRMIFAEIGVSFEARYKGPWRRVLKSAEHNEIDFLMGLKKTQERSQYLTYTEAPIFKNPFAIFVHKDRPFEFDGWASLEERRGGRNAGDRFGQPFDGYADRALSLESANTTAVNAAKLLAGRLDYMIHGRYVGQAYFEGLGVSEMITPLPNNLNDGLIHSGFTKDSPCVTHLPHVNQRYWELFNDGTAEALLDANIKRWGALRQQGLFKDVQKFDRSLR